MLLHCLLYSRRIRCMFSERLSPLSLPGFPLVSCSSQALALRMRLNHVILSTPGLGGPPSRRAAPHSTFQRAPCPHHPPRPSFMTSPGGISGLLCVCTRTCVYTVQGPGTVSDQRKKATPTHQLLGNSVTSIILMPCSTPVPGGSSKLISFARKDL